MKYEMPDPYDHSDPHQQKLDAFILRAGFKHGWMNVESAARSMAEQAVYELDMLREGLDVSAPKEPT